MLSQVLRDLLSLKVEKQYCQVHPKFNAKFYALLSSAGCLLWRQKKFMITLQNQSLTTGKPTKPLS